MPCTFASPGRSTTIRPNRIPTRTLRPAPSALKHPANSYDLPATFSRLHHPHYHRPLPPRIQPAQWRPHNNHRAVAPPVAAAASMPAALTAPATTAQAEVDFQAPEVSEEEEEPQSLAPCRDPTKCPAHFRRRRHWQRRLQRRQLPGDRIRTKRVRFRAAFWAVHLVTWVRLWIYYYL